MDENMILDSVTPINDDSLIKYHTQNDMFSNKYARIKPFILCNGRYLFSTMINDHYQNIVWEHTDGCIFKIKLDIKTGTNIGDLKYEGCDPTCEIINLINKLFTSQ